MRKTFIIILFLPVVLYVLGGLFFLFFQPQLTYFPDKSDFYSCEAFRDATNILHGKTRMYLIKKDPKKLIVFYHGNAASACSTGYVRDVIDSSGASVLIPEYSGYAGDADRPNKEHILANVDDVVAYLKTQKYTSIIVVGESLGTATASYHASLLPPVKLALISPFSSMLDVARARFWLYPFMPISESYDNISSLQNFTHPLLIIHGDSDDVVPPFLSLKLFDSVPSLDKKRLLIPGGEHEYIWTPEVREDVRDFIR